MAIPGWIEDRWLTKRPNPKTGKRERTKLYGKGLRYRVCGIPGVRKRSFETKEEAKTWLNDTIAAIKKKDFVDERDGEVLLGDYITQEWWPKQDYDESTSTTMERKIFKHIVGTSLGRTPMFVIDDDHLMEWRKELKSRGLGDGSIVVIWTHLSTIFKSAVGKRIAKNPCREAADNVRPKDSADTKARAWKTEEARAIRAAIPRRYQIVADLGMHAGLRQGETLAFSPDDVDEDAMVLHVRRQLQWTKNQKEAYFKLPKSDRERHVPLSPGLLKRIRQQEDEFPSAALTLPWKGPGNDNKKTATVRLLATTHWGNRIRYTGFNDRVMKPALAAAGIIAPRDESSPSWGWEQCREMMHHRWRHTYASVQLAAGEDIVSLSHWMGHGSVTITLDYYAHFMPDNGLRGRTAMDEWLEAGAPAVPTDLRGVPPLKFTVLTDLGMPAAAKESLELVLTGARYGGVWAVGAQLDANGPLLGEIRTEPSMQPDRALGAGLAWVEEYCGRHGLAVVHARNLSDDLPVELRPYQALARILVAPS